MSEEVICPKCKGNKFRRIGNTERQCLYCGTTFKVEEEKPVVKQEEKEKIEQPPTNWGEPLQFQTPPSVYVVNQQPQNDNSFAKGVAGGCLGVAAWYILGPIFGLIVLMAMCN